MALIKCPECGREISDKAPTCIHCGYPLTGIQAETTDASIPHSSNNLIDDTQMNDHTLGFSFFSMDENYINLECLNCGKIYSFNKSTSFSRIYGNECIPNNTICCPNCNNISLKGITIRPKTLQSGSNLIDNAHVNDNSLGFSFFSIDENYINLECSKCGKVYSFNKTAFSTIYANECIPNNTICCPNCSNTSPKDSVIRPKNPHNHITRGSDDTSGLGCFIYMIFIVIVIIVGVCFSIAKEGFNLGFILFYTFAVLLGGFVLYLLFSTLTSDPKELKENWDNNKYNNYKFTCPMCGSKKVKKISTTNRAVSVATVGLASSKIGKQYECDDCKHKW